jgi:hypothetical protein
MNRVIPSSQGMFQQQGFKSQNAPAKLVANEVVTTLADAVVQLSQARPIPAEKRPQARCLAELNPHLWYGPWMNQGIFVRNLGPGI